MATAGKSGTIEIPADTRERPPLPVLRFTVKEYHRLIELGILNSEDRVELIHGWLVPKVSQNPPHVVVVALLYETLLGIVEEGWCVRSQAPLTTTDSEPEPDGMIVRGTVADYLSSHPRPRNVGLVVEVADSSLPQDRGAKLELYAGVKIPVYWIVNIQDGRVEVYSRPRGGKSPSYRDREDFGSKDSVPVFLDGHEIGQIPVLTLLPFLADA